MSAKVTFITPELLEDLNRRIQEGMRSKDIERTCEGPGMVDACEYAFECLAGRFPGVAKDKAPSHSLLDIYAQGRQEAFADVIKVNAAKITALRDMQGKIAARIDEDVRTHERIGHTIDVLQKVSDGAQAAVDEAAEQRKELVL